MVASRPVWFIVRFLATDDALALAWFRFVNIVSMQGWRAARGVAILTPLIFCSPAAFGRLKFFECDYDMQTS